MSQQHVSIETAQQDKNQQKAQVAKLNGQRGEKLAAQWLLDNGFEILHSNWRSGHYEIDIVAQSLADGELHIVEVKTRSEGGFVSAEQAYTSAKFKALCKAASAYIELYGLDVDVRFDLITVDIKEDGRLELRFIPEVMCPSW